MQIKTQKKLDYLEETKDLIRKAIIAKGQPVAASATFRSYADKINAIQGYSEPVLESLEVTENGTYNAPDGVDGFSSVTVNVDPTRTTILSEQEFDGFVYDSNFGYARMLLSSPFELVLGKKYTVMWDGVEYTCTAYDGSVVLEGAVYIGNGSAFSQPSNGEPFAILFVNGACVFSGISDPTESHTIGIYQKTSGGSSADVRYVTFMSYDGLIEYGKKAVAVGDDCADPIARGVFSTPTRESDVQYNYTFYGWATAPNGGADANALKAVTEDKTVYANFTQAVRSYTITYYDDDGTTVLKTQILSYGSMPNYEPSKEGFSFDGWTPTLTMVTGSTSYTAVWTEKLVFANATWADIARASESGKASQMFSVGDTRKIPITFSNNRTYEVEFMIVDFGKDTLADGSGTAGMTIVSVPAIALSSSEMSRSLVNTSDANALTLSSTQKYSDSAIRTVVNTQLYGMLPSELRNVIKPVTKSSYHYSFSTTESTEKLWMLGRNEANYKSTLTAGRYEYFSSDANRKKTGIYASSATAVSAYTSNVPYMLRDGSSSNKNFHYTVSTNGTISYSSSYGQHTATSSYYAPVGFCI